MIAVSLLTLLLITAPLGAAAANLDILVSGPGGPVEDAVVFLDDGGPAEPVRREISQQSRQFDPRLLVIPAGSRVDFPNRDTTQHHVYSFSPAKTFELELYMGRPEAPVTFAQAGIVELGCNIHDRMQAFVLVIDHSAYARTDASGKAQLELPSGTDQTVSLNVWHARLPDNTQPLRFEVVAGEPARLALDLTPKPDTDSSLNRLQQRFREL
ncbi:MAG: methylamine utilization protein [Marinobacter sp. 34-60-7]|jgi:plastocyanin|nr:MAG: methylamine utilization protein [Marinobacter sp. 34-60-7]HET8849232.1 methylamine utilization protein [Marinobacter sp.]